MVFGLGKKDQSQYAAHSSTLPTVNAYPVYDAPTFHAMQAQPAPAPPAVAPSHVPPPPPQTYTPPSPIVDTSNTDFFVLLGRQPTIMERCPKCKIQNIRTRVKTYPSVASWLMTVGMIFVCFSYRYMPLWFLPIAFLPLFYDKLKKSDHFCGCCGKRVGSVAPLSDCGVMHYS
ncbi:hypothetical protein ACHAWO_002928 [Cyclotella atomus]|uniref:LITAF domain-containing protein n=1 Tax=Cyclotella atomus TaxID=382360 RepID=A0ABD3NPN4_9STRA